MIDALSSADPEIIRDYWLESVKDAFAGDILFLIDNRQMFEQGYALTNEQAKALGAITARGLQQVAADAFLLYLLEEGVRRAIQSKGAGKVFNRGATNTSELNANQFNGLKNNGVIDVGRSGELKPLTSTPNSYYTASGGHAIIYDSQGKPIYDIDPRRVKGFNISTNPAGQEFYSSSKLEGATPDFIKNLFGW